jgi:branched-chain amino acid transport system substrate-binding protein
MLWKYAARALVCVQLVLFASCHDAREVTIGFALGQVDQQAARMALSDAAAEGFDVAIDTIFAMETDNRAAPAIEIADHFAAQPGIAAVIGHSNSGASLAASHIYNASGIVQLAPNSTAAAYSDAGPFSYRMVPPDDRQGRWLAGYLLREHARSRIALMYVNDDYGRGLRNELLAALPANRINWVIDAPHTENVTPGSLSLTVRTLAASHPQLIVWLGRTRHLSRILPELRTALGDVEIIGGDALSSARQLYSDSGLWKDVRFVDFVDFNSSARLRGFRHRFTAQFKTEPQAPQVLAYDATRAVLSAIQAGARTGEDIRRYLDALGAQRPAYAGEAGLVQFDERGDSERAYVINNVRLSRRP